MTGEDRKGKEETAHYSDKKNNKRQTYLDSQRLGTLPAGALNLELHLQDINFFEELTGGWK